MSLTPKRIVFHNVFAEFRRDFNKIYSFSGLDRVSGMNFYQLVYDMCVAKPDRYSDRLFVEISLLLSEHCESVRNQILAHEDVVTAYAAAWKQYSLASAVVDSFCAYLNKIITKSKDSSGGMADKKGLVGQSKYKKQTIESLAFVIWRQTIIQHIKHNYDNRLIFQILALVKEDRDGREVPHETAKLAIDSFIKVCVHSDLPLQLYIDEFERLYIQAAQLYYQREAAESIAVDTISQYMIKVSRRLHQEVIRNRHYCDRSSYGKVIRQCENELIGAYKSRIYEDFKTMISEKRYNDCTTAYALLGRFEDGILPLLEVYKDYILDLGKTIVGQLGASITKNPREYVESLMSLHTEYMGISAKVFNLDSSFVAALDKAFRSIVNDTTLNRHANAPEDLAKYCDMLLKKNLKLAGSEVEIEDKLNRLIVLFTYIDDKDVFQKFYSRFLAKRLIYGMSLSEEAEVAMISRLKGTCGVEFTSKLQRMFTDMAVSTDMNTTYREASGARRDVDFNILVLTAGAWPLTQVPGSEFQLPEELEASVTLFTSVYSNQYNGRKLTWLWHLSKAEVKLFYLDKRYELAVSLYQLGLLLLYNTSPNLNFGEVRSHLRLSDMDLKRVVKPLLDLKLLLAPTLGSDGGWADRDALVLNMEFTSKRTKIKVSSAMQSDTPQETIRTRNAVEEDRKLYLQATVVRVMKSRQELSHTHLIQEVIDQSKSRFTPSVAMIKKCIDQLLEKAYIERSKEVRDRYVYIA